MRKYVAVKWIIMSVINGVYQNKDDLDEERRKKEERRKREMKKAERGVTSI